MNSPLKDRLIRKIRQLPDDILMKAYHVELIDCKVLLQHDQWLADRLRTDRDLSSDEDWLRFKVGDWTILMETED